jgi:hypothetical protein
VSQNKPLPFAQNKYEFKANNCLPYRKRYDKNSLSVKPDSLFPDCKEVDRPNSCLLVRTEIRDDIKHQTAGIKVEVKLL